MSESFLTTNQSRAVSLKDIPVLEYDRFYETVLALMEEEGSHCLNYFAFPFEGQLRFLCFIAQDTDKNIRILSHSLEYDVSTGASVQQVFQLKALTEKCVAMHIFEREISENYGIGFTGHPWLKPLRFPHSDGTAVGKIKEYPFYTITSDELHEVGVGPVHAGIIEPGHFRFICMGEKVLHLEIQLGYQHRGIEKLIAESSSGLKTCLLVENIAGDTAVGHCMAHAALIESLQPVEVPRPLRVERAIALELERIAMHLGDTAALCADIAYQLGQVVNESLRTLVINTTQLWCGSRFGKGLVRPLGTNYHMQHKIAESILKNLDIVLKRYIPMSDKMFSMPSVLSRYDGIAALGYDQLRNIGAVGMAARMGGLARDIRKTHPDSIYEKIFPGPVVLDSGDVLARALLRRKEIEQSVGLIGELLSDDIREDAPPGVPDYSTGLAAGAVGVRLVEGWRGEICHVAVTDDKGKVIHYKVKDPSMHNWMALALAMRNQEISDFPVCNKSFNLSYCGNDL